MLCIPRYEEILGNKVADCVGRNVAEVYFIGSKPFFGVHSTYLILEQQSWLKQYKKFIVKNSQWWGVKFDNGPAVWKLVNELSCYTCRLGLERFVQFYHGNRWTLADCKSLATKRLTLVADFS